MTERSGSAGLSTHQVSAHSFCPVIYMLLHLGSFLHFVCDLQFYNLVSHCTFFSASAFQCCICDLRALSIVFSLGFENSSGTLSCFEPGLVPTLISSKRPG